jgi:hypothetical protein
LRLSPFPPGRFEWFLFRFHVYPPFTGFACREQVLETIVGERPGPCPP